MIPRRPLRKVKVNLDYIPGTLYINDIRGFLIKGTLELGGVWCSFVWEVDKHKEAWVKLPDTGKIWKNRIRTALIENANELDLGSPPSEKRSFYDEYINSEKWRAKRALKLEQVDNRCGICGKSGEIVTLHCHHLDYDSLGNEPLSSLSVFCEVDHEMVHRLYPQTKADFATVG